MPLAGYDFYDKQKAHCGSCELRCVFLLILFEIHVQQRKHRSHSQSYLFLDFSCQVKDLDCEGIFGNIEGVLEISQKLLKNLDNAVQDKEGKDQELGNVHDENSNSPY